MVFVSKKRRLLEGCPATLKVRTLTLATTLLSTLMLLSEPILYRISHEAIDRELYKDAYLEESFNRTSYHPTPSDRFGMAPKRFLRTPWLVELDLLEQHQQYSSTRTPKQQSHPRIVTLDQEILSSSLSSEVISRPLDPIGGSDLNTDVRPERRPFEKSFYDDCQPKVSPQAHPSCNNIHEIHLTEDILLLSMKGSWRSVWKVDGDDDREAKCVLKLLDWNRTFDHESLDAHAMDAMAMDHLTGSPYVVNAYSYCAQSVITEYASITGRDLIKDESIRYKQRLKMARDLARGLADIHAFRNHHDFNKNRKEDSTVFAHNDINIANTVAIDGSVRWNDFNLGFMLREPKKDSNLNEKDCYAPVQYEGNLWRSPEEVRNTTLVETDKADMYGFGNILFQVLTRHQPWTHKETDKLSMEDIVAKKREGQLPTIPEQYLNSTRTEIHALLMATVGCYHPNPKKRPSAYQLAQSLGTAYESVKDSSKRLSLQKIHELFISPSMMSK